MKYIVFLGNHKTFSSLRLGVRLAQVLAWHGNDVVLMGSKGKLPDYTGIKTVEFSAAVTCKKLMETFQKYEAEKIISFVSLPACEAAVAAKIPFIYFEPENFREEKSVKNKKVLLKKAQRVVVLTNSAKALDKKTYVSNAVRVTNPALWVEHFSFNKPACFKKENNILACGKLNKSGGFDVLLKAWNRLAQAHSSWHLTIVGDGPSKTSLKKFIEKNNLSASTEILPAATDLYSLMRCADIYVNPTKEEDGLEETLDAMASKLPVVLSDVKGATDLISHDVNGKLVPSGQEDALKDALDELMVDWGKRVGLAVEAYRLKARYPLEVFVSFFEEE